MGHAPLPVTLGAAHQRLGQRREEENRQGQNQGDPEPLSKIRRHMGVMIVVIGTPGVGVLQLSFRL